MPAENVKLLGLTGAIEALKSLPPELVSKRGGPIRRALRKGAKLLLERARANVQRIIDEQNVDGRFVSTGLAKESLRIKATRAVSGNGEAVIVAVKPRQSYAGRTIKRKGRKVAALMANDVLFMLEHGTERRRPMPWMRPAFEEGRVEALDTIVAETRKGVEAAIKKAGKIAAAKAGQP